MSADALHYYTDLLGREQWLGVALCWTVIEPLRDPLTIPDVVRRLGGDPADLQPLPPDAIDDHVRADYSAPPLVHFTQVGRAVAMIEYNGFQGSLPEVLGRLSVGARVHSAYWNVNRDNALSSAAFGHLLVTLDAQFPDSRVGLDIGVLDSDLDVLYEALHSDADSARP